MYHDVPRRLASLQYSANCKLIVCPADVEFAEVLAMYHTNSTTVHYSAQFTTASYAPYCAVMTCHSVEAGPMTTLKARSAMHIHVLKWRLCKRSAVDCVACRQLAAWHSHC